MTAQPELSRAENIADNVYFRLLSRTSMILVSLVFIPLAMTILLRTYDAVREVREAQIRDASVLTRAVADIAGLNANGWTAGDAARDRVEAERRFVALELFDDKLERRLDGFSARPGR